MKKAYARDFHFHSFLVLVFITSILTLTTSPISITDGIEDIIKPIKED